MKNCFYFPCFRKLWYDFFLFEIFLFFLIEKQVLIHALITKPRLANSLLVLDGFCESYELMQNTQNLCRVN